MEPNRLARKSIAVVEIRQESRFILENVQCYLT